VGVVRCKGSWKRVTRLIGSHWQYVFALFDFNLTWSALCPDADAIWDRSCDLAQTYSCGVLMLFHLRSLVVEYDASHDAAARNSRSESRTESRFGTTKLRRRLTHASLAQCPPSDFVPPAQVISSDLYVYIVLSLRQQSVNTPL